MGLKARASRVQPHACRGIPSAKLEVRLVQKLRRLTEDGGRLELETHPVLRKARPWPEPAPGEHGSRGGQGRGPPRPAAAGLRPLPSSAPAPDTSPELAQTPERFSSNTPVCANGGYALRGAPSSTTARIWLYFSRGSVSSRLPTSASAELPVSLLVSCVSSPSSSGSEPTTATMWSDSSCCRAGGVRMRRKPSPSVNGGTSVGWHCPADTNSSPSARERVWRRRGDGRVCAAGTHCRRAGRTASG